MGRTGDPSKKYRQRSGDILLIQYHDDALPSEFNPLP
jgi:hypothetical protein